MNQDPQDIPIRGLADLESDVSASFRAKVWRTIQRRTTVSQYANFSWTLPGVIFLEFLTVLVHLFSVADGKRGKSQ
jgi:hypothetical protein